MPYPPHKDDLPIQHIADKMYDTLKSGMDVDVYIKWTCPACGDRVVSDAKCVIVNAPDGSERVKLAPYYLHTSREDGTPCMHSVKWDSHVFGFLTVIRMS